MDFLPGLELSRRFWTDCVCPLLASRWPRLDCSAALVGYGSEVLGLDDATSMDHAWGPRLLLVLSDSDHAALAQPIRSFLADRLPDRFLGFPVGWSPRDASGISWMLADAPRPLDHRVEVLTLDQLLGWMFPPEQRELIRRGRLTASDWMALSEQGLVEFTAGEVFHDGLDCLGPLRRRLAVYPDDVRRAKMISLLHGVESEEAFPGRSVSVGDLRGARLSAGRLCSRIMKLCFLLEGRYIPYSKWFGPAFARLDCAPRIGPLVDAVLEGPARRIPGALADLYRAFLDLLGASGLAAPFDPVCSDYHGRPWPVIHAGRLIDALHQRIADPDLAARDLKLANLPRILDGYEV